MHFRSTGDGVVRACGGTRANPLVSQGCERRVDRGLSQADIANGESRHRRRVAATVLQDHDVCGSDVSRRSCPANTLGVWATSKHAAHGEPLCMPHRSFASF